MSRVLKENFPGNNDPHTVTPSTRVTGSINDTKSHMHVHVVAGLGWIPQGKLSFYSIKCPSPWLL